jgi:hypothetical protein
VIVGVDGRVIMIVIMAMVAASVVVIMVMTVPLGMGVRFVRFVIVVAASVIVMVIVGMSVIMMMIVGVAVRGAVIMMMIVVTGIPVGMIVGADTDGAVAMDEIEGTEEEEADPRDQGVDAEARIEVFLNAAAPVEVEKKTSPDHEGEDREHLQEFFHGRKSGGDDREAGITVASKHNSARRSRQRARSRGRKRSGV